MKRFLFSVVLIALFVGCAENAAGYVATIIYLDAAADPGGDGASWVSARRSFDAALAVAHPGDEIRVAAGVYSRPGGSTDPVLEMIDGVDIVGGFGGPSVIDGRGECVHVVEGASNAVLDGFTITGGNARYDWPDYNGGGMNNVDVRGLVVKNCIFIENHTNRRGGGVYNNYSKVRLVGCDFFNNTAEVRGGGLCNHSSVARIERCRFIGNQVTSSEYGGPDQGKGGAIHSINNSRVVIVNCEFQNNVAPLGWPDVFTDSTSEETWRTGRGHILVTCQARGHVLVTCPRNERRSP